MITVPVVVYENGRRTVVGTASVNVDGSNLAVVAEINPEFAKRVHFEVRQLSFSPIPPEAIRRPVNLLPKGKVV